MVAAAVAAAAAAATPPIMNTMYNLTDRYGPRLTNSPQFRAAGDWAVGQLKEWGLSNVQLEKWADRRRTRRRQSLRWEFTGFSAAMVEPTYMPHHRRIRRHGAAAPTER